MAPSDSKHQQLAMKRVSEQWAGADPADPAAPAPAVALLLLAAGGSTRMGRPKQLLEYDGRPLLRHSVEQALGSRCRPVVVVLGADADACRAVIHDLPVQIVVNHDWAQGMGSSIRAGMSALALAGSATGEPDPASDAVVVALCDQPLISSAFLDALVQLHVDQHAPMVAASYDNHPGVPALFARALFPRLAALFGQAGAKALLQAADSGDLLTIPAPQAAVDVDTPDDYARLLRTPTKSDV
jgi:molybdenum cofactor cytidylyltransferase